jgi:hypothetical protein
MRQTGDLEGNEIGSYPMKGGKHRSIFTCYVPPAFIFTIGENDFIELRTAEPE